MKMRPLHVIRDMDPKQLECGDSLNYDLLLSLCFYHP